jgi:hypothetical protein
MSMDVPVPSVAVSAILHRRYCISIASFETSLSSYAIGVSRRRPRKPGMKATWKISVVLAMPLRTTWVEVKVKLRR